MSREKIEEIYRELIGEDGLERYTHKEIIEYIKRLKDIEEKYYDSQKT